ncbi:MAG TPA: hypothetical protein VGF74_08980 [Thermoleophilaceae bacterium]
MSAAVLAHEAVGAIAARVERLEHIADRIELQLRLGDGSRCSATLLDDGVNSLELLVGATVFVRANGTGQAARQASPEDIV